MVYTKYTPLSQGKVYIYKYKPIDGTLKPP